MADESTVAAPAPASSESTSSSSSPTSSTPSTPATPAPAISTTPATPASVSPEDGFSAAIKAAADRAEKQLTEENARRFAPPVNEPAKPAAEVPQVAPPAAVEEAKPAEPIAAPVENPLDKIGPLPGEKIAAAFKDAPQAVQDWAKEKGLTAETLVENARLAAQTSQFMERFPTLKAADEALQGAEVFWKLDQQFPAIKDQESYDKFMMDTLVPLTFERDENGNPIPDPNNPGAFKNDGSVSNFIKMTTDVEVGKLQELGSLMLKSATSEEDKGYAEDLVGAVKFITDFRNAGYRKPGAATDLKTLPADVQARLAEADRREREYRERDTSQSQNNFESAENSIMEDTYKQLAPMVQEILGPLALKDTLKTRLAKEAWGEVTDRVLKNHLYLRERDTANPRVADYKQQRVATNLTYMKPVLVRTLANLAEEFGAPVVDANKDRMRKIETQTEAGRMEPRTGAVTVQSHAPSGTQDNSTKALEIARAEHPGQNIQPGSREYWAALAKVKGLPTSA